MTGPAWLMLASFIFWMTIIVTYHVGWRHGFRDARNIWRGPYE